MSRTALFVSPHLDDAAFSCGATIACLVDHGWRCVLATVFTGSVAEPRGFALACQLDKGLGSEVDYMALRRDEDAAAAAVLGAEPLWLGLLEAPHRGYASAAALFDRLLENDDATPRVTRLLDGLMARLEPDLVFAPQAIGGHVDHVHVVRALGAQPSAASRPTVWWRDLPYAMRAPAVTSSALARESLLSHVFDVRAGLARKLDACVAYRTQIGFQFGDARKLRDALTRFAEAEGGGSAVERFLATAPAARMLTAALGTAALSEVG